MAVRRSVIVVNYHADVWVERLQKQLRHEPDTEVIVIDNSQHPERGYGAALNAGAQQAQGEILFLANPDITLGPHVLSVLEQVLRGIPEVGLVGPQIQNEAGEIQSTSGPIPTPRTAILHQSWLRKWFRPPPLPDPTTSQVVGHVAGCFWAVRARDWQRLGGCDEHITLYHEEYDVCGRLWSQLHLATYFCADAWIQHQGQVSTNQVPQKTSQAFRDSRRYWLQREYGWRGSIAIIWLEFNEWLHYWLLNRKRARA